MCHRCGSVGELRGEGKGVDSFDLRLQIRHTGAEPDEPRDSVMTVVRQ
jgi:hypothetical protein